MSLVDRLRVLLATVAIVALVPLAAGPEQTEAAWTDPEHATTAVSSGFVARPNPAQACTFTTLAATFSWTAGTGGVPRAGYVATAYLDGAVVGTTTYAANATSGTTSGLLTSLLANRTYEIRLQAYFSTTDATAWRSTPIVGTLSTTALGLITGCTGFVVP